MIIAAYSRIKVDKVLRYGNLSAVAACIAALILWIAIFCFSPWQREEEMVTFQKTPRARTSETFISHSAIGSGPLSLRCTVFCPFTSFLRDEVMVLAKNSRPDVSLDLAEVLVHLKSSEEELSAVSGALLYLKEDAGSLHFTDDPTDFWVKPSLTASGDLRLEARRGAERIEWIYHAGEELGKSVGNMGITTRLATPLQRLREGRYWGHDLLIQQYAGHEHQGLRNKSKLVLDDEVLFVGEGDYLVWKEGRWNLSLLDGSSGGAPLARVRSASPRSLEMEVWDESGFHRAQIALDMQHAPKFGGQPDQIPSSIRVRNATQIACTLGKKRLILKEGDWLIKGSSGWRKLRSAEEIERCLNHSLKGELLIFDRLEKLPGKIVLHAHIFDEMHTQVQTLALPIAAEKKKKRGGGKK